MKCPKCGSRKVAPIMYGLPALSKDLEERLNNKKLVLGGCCVSDNDPRYYCFGCEQKIGYPAHYGDVVSVSFSRG
ncbi:MAG: hypothetical protein LUD41_02665 [Phascolarctobacterium sp.]|nr:hypothetical protein [Phascolarctobacterium sp.]